MSIPCHIWLDVGLDFDSSHFQHLTCVKDKSFIFLSSLQLFASIEMFARMSTDNGPHRLSHSRIDKSDIKCLVVAIISDQPVKAYLLICRLKTHLLGSDYNLSLYRFFHCFLSAIMSHTNIKKKKEKIFPTLQSPDFAQQI